ncbi:hypothetical protein SAMN05421785_12433, partial [Chryseobacterium gambrini]
MFKVLKFKYLTKTSAMISDDKITTIYYIVDEFFKEFNHVLKEYSLQDQKIKKRNRRSVMSESEVMTIMILFHYG